MPNTSDGQVVNAKPANGSAVATNAGTLVVLPDLAVSAARINNFVERYRKEYFEDHSLEWALDQILDRGMAEITRQVKTARERARQKSAGDLIKEFNLTPQQAKEFLRQALAKQAAEATAAVKAKS